MTANEEGAQDNSLPLSSRFNHRIESGLPYCFGGGSLQKESAISSAMEKFSAFLHSAFADTLSPSTRQYQTYLLTAAVLWLLAHLFKLTTISIGGQSIPISAGFAITFSMLIVLLALVFAWKAQTDVDVRRLQNTSKFALYRELPDLVGENTVRMQIDLHYFHKFSDLISVAYVKYDAQSRKKLGLTEPEQERLALGDLVDISAASRNQRFASQIRDRELLLLDVSTRVKAAVNDLCKRIDRVGGGEAEDGPPYDAIDRMYEQSHFKHWVDARNQLTDQQAAFVFGDVQRVSGDNITASMQTLLDRAKHLSSRTVWVEVFLPIAFAIAALGVYWLPRFPWPHLADM